MQRWTVLFERGVEKQLKRLPKEIVEILGQFILDVETHGPRPQGWIVKHVQGQQGTYSARLKREYRVLYEVVSPQVIIVSVSHRKEAY